MRRAPAIVLALAATAATAGPAHAAPSVRQDVDFATTAGSAGTIMRWAGSVPVPRSWRRLEDDADAMRWVVRGSRRCTVDVTLRFSGAVAATGPARSRLESVLPASGATVLSRGDTPAGAFRALAPARGPLVRGALVFAARPPVVLPAGDGVWAQVALTARTRKGSVCPRLQTRRALQRPARDVLRDSRLQTATTYA